MVEPQAPTAALQDEAIAWHLRLPALTGDEWADFAEWLEASPLHRAAYDQVVDADALAAEVLGRSGRAAARAPAPDDQRHEESLYEPGLYGPGRYETAGRFARRHRGPLALGAAACLALVAAVGLWPSAGTVQLEETRAGNTKQLDFADGTRIDLNGETALALDQADPRQVELKHGEARFAVRHGARRFTVAAGGYVLQDLGTVFNVRLTDSALVLDVAEGKVLFDPEGAALTITAGEQIAVDRQNKVVVKRESAQAGDWRTGELAFTDASLAEVAEALRRRYGTPILLSAGLHARPFSGNVRFTGDPAKDVPHLARLIGADYRREGQGWIITGEPGR